MEETHKTLEISDSSASRYARLCTLQNNMKHRFLSDSPVFSTMILAISPSGTADTLCSPYFVSDNLRRDYDSNLINFNGLSYDAFISEIRGSAPHSFNRNEFISGSLDYSYNGKYSGNVGIYVYCDNSSDTKSSEYYILAIDLDILKSKLSSFYYAGDYFSIVGNGKTLFTTDSTVSLTSCGNNLFTDGVSDKVYLHCVVKNLGFSCYVSLDSSKMYEKIGNFKGLLNSFLYIFPIMILFLIVLLFLLWYYPMLKASRKYQVDGNQRHVVEAIDSYMMTLVEKNKQMADKLESIEPTVKNDMLRRLYTGKSLSEEEKRFINPLIPLREDSQFCCLAVGNLEPGTDMSSGGAVCGKLSDAFPTLCMKTQIDNAFVMLLPLSADEAVQAVSGKIEAVLDSHNQNNPLCAIGLSNVYLFDKKSIAMAYNEAKTALQEAVNWQSAACVQSSLVYSDARSFDLPYHTLEDLYHAMKGGNTELALNIYNSCVEKNFSEQNGSHQAFYQQFIRDIQGIFIRLSAKCPISSVVSSCTNMDLPACQQITLLREAVRECCELIAASAQKQSLSGEIQLFCQEHFTDPMFSLGMVAEQFHLSESSLSKLFKAQTGSTFSSYLERLRIYKAESYLQEGKLTVKEIAEKVGYANSATFYNAFRRAHNCTPSQWISLHKNEKQ